MKRVKLDANWKLYGSEVGTLNATVPGCVHTDLIDNGIIKNIFWRDNNKNYQWIENCDWEYSCIFDASPDKNVRIVFDCLDTYADVFLNGTLVGSVDNMFIPHIFDVSGILKSFGNDLKVCFRSPIKEVADKPLDRGAFSKERMNTRRMQCTYGWDWVDRFVTCGISGDVWLEYKNGIDVESVYIKTDFIDSFGAQISVDYNFSDFEEGAIAHTDIIDSSGEIVAHTDFYVDREYFVRRFDIPQAKLWYPNGYGEQPLYRLEVKVGKNTFEQVFGIRTLRILQLEDKKDGEYYEAAKLAELSEAGQLHGNNTEFSGFAVIVNGVRIFCRGGNWVPCEPFICNITDKKINMLISLAKDMGANFIRVWGGGVFEKKSFYDACDKSGILVAQDFQMACGYYPEKQEWFIKAMTLESEFAVKYLRNHPCLAWYHGDNENATKGSDIQKDHIGRESVLSGIAPQIYKYDYMRQLLPTSPYGGNTHGSITRGTSHTTNFLTQIFEYFENTDCSDYRKYFEQFVSRFVSEEGTFGAVMRPSMLKFMTEYDLLEDSDEDIILYHTRGNPVLPKEIFEYVKIFAKKLLGEFTDGEDKFFKYKYLQYEWIRFSFENVRNRLGYCNGIIYWMFNDCWPAALGWSLVDYFGLPKPSYYSFKRCAKEIIGSITIKEKQYLLNASSDKNIDVSAKATAYKIKDGSIIESVDIDFSIRGYGVTAVALPFDYDSECVIVCDIHCNEISDRCFYKSGTLDIIPSEDIVVTCLSDDSITLASEKYLHAVELEGEYVFEDNYFSMLPTQVKTIHLKKCGERNGLSVKAYTFRR